MRALLRAGGVGGLRGAVLASSRRLARLPPRWWFMTAGKRNGNHYALVQVQVLKKHTISPKKKKAPHSFVIGTAVINTHTAHVLTDSVSQARTLSPPPHANSFVIGTAVINTHPRPPTATDISYHRAALRERERVRVLY